jgi:hypothetical protein
VKDTKETLKEPSTTTMRDPLIRQASGHKQQQSSTTTATNGSGTPATSVKPKMSTITNAVIAQEWVMCESCKKWRKLPLSIAASSLPETWVCSMNTWNIAQATCSAPVEEGSEETTEEGNNAGSQESANTTVPKRASVLPPGINLYGGQVQVPAVTVGPGGQKLPRIVSYRDLIGAHYRYNRNFSSTFNTTCDARYGGFSAYQSPTLKTRPFENTENAFPMMGWKQVKPVVSIGKGNSSLASHSSASSTTSAAMDIEQNNFKTSRPESCLPPKKKIR